MKKVVKPCNFCGKTHNCIESAVSGATVCQLCLQNFEEMLGTIPVGAVKCPACKSFTDFIVTYEKSTLHYKAAAFDMHGILMYLPVKAEGFWEECDVKKAVHCGHCSAEVPVYLFSRTGYIR